MFTEKNAVWMKKGDFPFSFFPAGRMNLRPEPACDGMLQRQLADVIRCFGSI